MPKMNLHRAQELIVPLRKGTANDISLAWQARLIEALEYVIEHESQPTQRAVDGACAHPFVTYYNNVGHCIGCGAVVPPRR